MYSLSMTGFRFAVVLLLVPCGMWISSRLALRMGPFMQHLSIAETMGSIYGKYTMLITGLDSALNCIIMVTTQITIMSEAICMCVPLANPYVISIFCTSFILFLFYFWRYSCRYPYRYIAIYNFLHNYSVALLVSLCKDR